MSVRGGSMYGKARFSGRRLVARGRRETALGGLLGVALALGGTLGVGAARAAPGLLLPQTGRPLPTTAPAQVERPADAAEGIFWRQKAGEGPGTGAPPAGTLPQSPPPRGPFVPLAVLLPPGATGPLALADLRLLPNGKGGFRGRRPGYRFEIEADGSVTFQDKRAVSAPRVAFYGLAAVATAAFDVNDMLMRLRGKDPYAYDKRRVLEVTAELRDKMVDEDRARRIQDGLAAFPDRLEQLWARSDLPPSVRRALLVQLWDDLSPGPTAEGRAAAAARAELIAFVRAKLPPGHAAAFTPGELARLNAGRTGAARFAPYDPAPAATTAPAEGPPPADVGD